MEFFESLEQKCRRLFLGKNYLNDPEPITAINRQIQLVLDEIDSSRRSFKTQFGRLEKKRLSVETEKLQLDPGPTHSREIWTERRHMKNSLSHTLAQIEQSIGYLVSDYNRTISQLRGVPLGAIH